MAVVWKKVRQRGGGEERGFFVFETFQKEGWMMRNKVLICSFVLLVLFVSTPLFAAEKEIKIGVLYPLSGAAATIGRDLQKAAEWTAEELINNKKPDIDLLMTKWGGIPNLGGAKIKLIFADHRGEPDRGAGLATRLIEGGKVVGVRG